MADPPRRPPLGVTAERIHRRAAGEAALAQPRWHRGTKAQVTVYVEKTRVGATNWSF